MTVAPIAVTQLLTDAATWASGAASPAAGAGLAAGIGSIYLQNGAPPTTPASIYLKLAAANVAWTRQNLTGINVYNIRNFGAKGDGITDDTPAIRAAIAAAVAAGGGCIYIPPTSAFYACTKPTDGSIGSFNLDNKHDLMFLGDGYASRLRMVGSSSLGEWYLFRLHDGTTRIQFYNVAMDGPNITNPDPGSQNHLIDNSGVVGDAHGGTSNVDIVGCWFGRAVGAGVRNIGESTATVENIRILYNAFTMNDGVNGSRSCVEAQRYSRHIQVQSNWIFGAHDNQIDFEPTGGAAGDAGPREWQILYNHCEHQSQPTDAFALSGISLSTDPALRNQCSYNTITNGGAISGVRMQAVKLTGNVLGINNTAVTSCINLFQICTDIEMSSNVVTSENQPFGREGLEISASTGASGWVCSDNIADVGNNGDINGVYCETMSELLIDGNVLLVNQFGAAAQGYGVHTRTVNESDDHLSANGNLVIGTGASLETGVDFHANPFNLHNCMANYNFSENAVRVVEWSRGAAESFLDWRMATANNAAGAAATGGVNPPPDGSGCGIEGNAGPGPQIQTIQAAGVTPEGAVTSSPGSLCTNTSGVFTSGNILTYKESGSGNTGWQRISGSQIQQGCTDALTGTGAVFCAPGGQGLGPASATEIRWRCFRAGTFRNLRITCTPGTGGTTATYTVRKNGANAALSATISNTANSGVGAGTFNCVVGDTLGMAITHGAAPITGQKNIVANMELAD